MTPFDDVSALVDSLLEGEVPAPRVSSHSRRPSSPLPRVTESSVKARLRTGRAATFSEQEVGLIYSLLEQAERGIFGGDDITSEDLKKLGFQVSDDDQSGDTGDDLSDIFPSSTSDEEEGRESMEKIPVTAALTAPDNTLGGNEPIPQEVQAALDVLKPQGVEKPVPSLGAAPAPAPAPSMSAPPPSAAAPAPSKDPFDLSDVFENQKKSVKRDWLAEATAALQSGDMDDDPPLGGETITEGETAGNALALLQQLRTRKK